MGFNFGKELDRVDLTHRAATGLPLSPAEVQRARELSPRRIDEHEASARAEMWMLRCYASAESASALVSELELAEHVDLFGKLLYELANVSTFSDCQAKIYRMQSAMEAALLERAKEVRG